MSDETDQERSPEYKLALVCAMCFSEILTPLASARGYLQLMQRDDDLPKEERDEFIANALRGLERVRDLVGQARAYCDPIIHPKRDDDPPTQPVDVMRVLVVGRVGDDVVNVFPRLLHQLRPGWDVTLVRYGTPEQILTQITSYKVDCVLLVDRWDDIGSACMQTTECISLPIVAAIGRWTRERAYQLRCNSIYPMMVPCASDEPVRILETQTPLLRDEIASPNRAQLARAAADKLFPEHS